MRLNLGCGDRYADGWWNVDWAGSPRRKDETYDLRESLPWVEVEYAYVGHLLEHLTIKDCLILLPRLLRCMNPGGQIMVVGPDVEAAKRMAVVGALDVSLDELRDGARRWPGDEHHWECTVERVIDLLEVTGWTNVTSVGIGNVAEMWPVADRGPQWQCAVSARRSDE